MNKAAPMTITEKILAAHTGKKKVSPGELIDARIDIALGNDITAPLAIQAFKEVGARKVFNRHRVVLVQDHFVPAKDIPSAEQSKILRNFAKAQRLTNYFEVGEAGIEHALLPDKGLVLPGDVVIGADSHTCTYGAVGAFSTGVGSTDLAAVMATGRLWFKVPESLKLVFHGKVNRWVSGKDFILFIIGQIGVDGALYQAMEFSGETMRSLPMSGRLTIANMAIEAGGKSGIFEPDEITLQYVKPRAQRPYRLYTSDPDARYADIREFDASTIHPQVALPHIPSNVKDVREVGKIEIDQVVIGSCTNGRLDDLAIAAKIMKGHKVAPQTRMLIFPASAKIYRQALGKGYVGVFMQAGAVVMNSGCGPCLGVHEGALGDGEVALSTTNRNFKGRMGNPNSEVYLCSPSVAAASALTGVITDPRKK